MQNQGPRLVQRDRRANIKVLGEFVRSELFYLFPQKKIFTNYRTEINYVHELHEIYREILFVLLFQCTSIHHSIMNSDSDG